MSYDQKTRDQMEANEKFAKEHPDWVTKGTPTERVGTIITFAIFAIIILIWVLA